MKKQYWKDITVIIASLLSSGFLFYYVFTYMRIFSYVGTTASISLQIIFAYAVFMVYKLITSPDKRSIYMKIFLFMYAGLFIVLLLSRNNPVYGVNMKIGYINDFAPYVFWANMLILAPVGFLVSFLYGLSWFITLPVALVSIIILETLQYMLRRGCLDINDIILNSLGMVLGIVCFRVYNGIKTKKYNWEIN